MMELEQIIIEKLYSLNTCKFCIKRLLAANDESIQEKIDTYVESYGKNHVKRYKASPCKSCLDIYSYLDEIAKRIAEMITKNNLDNYRLVIKVPYAIIMRNKSFSVFLNEKYPEYYKDKIILQPYKPLYFLIMNNLLKTYKIKYRFLSNVRIHINFEYSDDKKEYSKLVKEDIGAKNFKKKIQMTGSSIIKKYVGVPPDTPTVPAILRNIELIIQKYYIGGRYLKFDKNFSQGIGERSITNLFKNVMSKVFGITSSDIKIYFCGSDGLGYRVLGTGRPFCVTLCNLRKKPDDNSLEIVAELLNQTSSYKVSSLSYVSPNDLLDLKDKGVSCTRTFRYICKIQCAEKLGKAIQQISMLDKDGFFINQKTPLGVIRQRTQGVRTKKILHVDASTVQDYPDLIDISLIVECGTYTEEFIHGDLGRTKPNIRDIIGCEISILSKDLLSIAPDFPPLVSNDKDEMSDDEFFEEVDFDIHSFGYSVKDDTGDLNVYTGEVKDEKDFVE
ncbi:unnamed protein product [Brassicogethes aeneus]|uniref:tRNA pseudouridine(55) synthase n=1 Tax=Brassicogethes aeneus TaxID=1431903 RepID=A0A9P0BDP0_BRAAE|nr:unnamed protein product [Brassicogethes aeneus]